MSSASAAGAGAPAAKVEPRSFLYGVTLGEGAYARVMHCRLRQPAAPAPGAASAATPTEPPAKPVRAPPDFAVKIMEKHLIKRENKAALVMLERLVMSRAQHPNIVRLAYSFQDAKYLYFVMELCRGRELFKAIRSFSTAARKAGRPDEGLPLPVTRFVLAQLVSTLCYLHGTLNTVHRDLKPENVMLTEKGHLKLIDFGSVKDESGVTARGATPPAKPEGAKGAGPEAAAALAGWLQQLHGGWDAAAFVGSSSSSSSSSTSAPAPAPAPAEPDAFVGTAEYVSPEVLSDESAHAPADLWAVGAVAYQCLTGRPPCRGASEYLTFQQILGLDAEATAAWFGIDLTAPVALATPEETVRDRLAGLQGAAADGANEGSSSSVYAAAAAVRSRLAPSLAASYDVLCNGAGVYCLPSPGDSPWAAPPSGTSSEEAASRARRTASVALAGGALLGLTGDATGPAGGASDRRSVRVGSVSAALASVPPTALLIFPPHVPLVALDFVLRLMRTRPSQRLGVLGVPSPLLEPEAAAATTSTRAVPGSWALPRPPPFYCGPVALDYSGLKSHPLFTGIEWEVVCDPKVTKAPWVPTLEPLPEPTESSPDGFASLNLLGEDGVATPAAALAPPPAAPQPAAAASGANGAVTPVSLQSASSTTPARAGGAATGTPPPPPASSSNATTSAAPRAKGLDAPPASPSASTSSSVVQFFETLLSGGTRSFSSSSYSAQAGQQASGTAAAAAAQPPPSPTRSLTPSRSGVASGRDSARGGTPSWLESSPAHSSRPGPVSVYREPLALGEAAAGAGGSGTGAASSATGEDDEASALPVVRLCLTGLGLPEDEDVVPELLPPGSAEGGLRRGSSSRGSRATSSFARRPSASRGPATDLLSLCIVDYFAPPSLQLAPQLASSATGLALPEDFPGTLSSESSSGSLVRTSSPATSRRGSHTLSAAGASEPLFSPAGTPHGRCASPSPAAGSSGGFRAASPGAPPRSPSPASRHSAGPAAGGGDAASSSGAASAAASRPGSSSPTPGAPAPPWADAYWAAFLDRAAGEEPLAWARMRKRNAPVLFPLWHALPLLHPAAGSMDRDLVLTHFPATTGASSPASPTARVPRLLYCHPQGKNLRLAIDLRPEPEARRGSTVPAVEPAAADKDKAGAGDAAAAAAAGQALAAAVARVTASSDGTSLDISVQQPRGKALALTLVAGGWGAAEPIASAGGTAASSSHHSSGHGGGAAALGHALGGMFSPPSFLRGGKKKAAAAAAAAASDSGGTTKPPLAPLAAGAPPSPAPVGTLAAATEGAASGTPGALSGRLPPCTGPVTDEAAAAAAWAHAISTLAAGLPLGSK